MLMAGSVVGSQLPVERDVLLTQLRSSSWRDREAAVLALIDAHPTDANLLKRLDVQYVFLWLAERENEALWRRYVAGMDSEERRLRELLRPRGRTCFRFARERR